MKIQYASDLHLEFKDNSNYLKHCPLEVVGDILVLAGDIGYLGDDNYSKHPFWDWVSSHFKHTYVVPGNHELYKLFDINELHNGWHLNIRENVTCHYNSIIHLTDDIDLILTTLWSHIELKNAFATEHSVSDFRRIRNGEELLDWVRFNTEHDKCINFLLEALKKSTSVHKIVATHHVPSYDLVATEFIDSPTTGAFASELKRLIATQPIEYWIYGHSHRNIDTVIGRTQCVSNQLGYVFANEHKDFNQGKYFEI